MAVTLPNTSRSAALNLSTDLAQAGATFNDATRLLDGGLWANPSDSNNQQAYLGLYTADIHAVLADINQDLANPGAVTINGQAYTLTAADTAALSEVQGQLQTLLTEAPLSVGNSAAATQAQELIHITQTSILSEINGDTGLATALGATPYAAGTGANNVGFEALPVGADNAAAITAATTQGASLAQVGAVYNAAVDLAVGGLNSANMAEFTADMKAVGAGVQNILNSPTQLAAIESGETATAAALTTIHLETVENQVNLQLNKFDGMYATNPDIAARSTNDNLLDIIDIVQNDANLNPAAGGNGTPGSVGGFAEMPAYLNGPGGPNANGGTVEMYQDNQAQTNFWAQFIAEANTINNQLNAVAGGQNTSPAEISALVTEIQNYQQFGASFDQSQAGVFGARFDNELLSGTLLADTNNAVQGLQGIANGDTGAALAADQAQIKAAGHGFVDDANDVSGNNVPLGGGTYVGTSTTVAGATSVPGLAQGTVPVNPVADGTTGLSSTGSTTTSVPPTMPTAPTPPAGPGTGDPGAGTGAAPGANLVNDFLAFVQGHGNAQTVLNDLTSLAGGQNELANLFTQLEQASGNAPGGNAPGGGAEQQPAPVAEHPVHPWHW
jgi:trimeric autotransporter adhesin